MTTKLNQLLAELCPKGVEWKKLGEVCGLITDFTAAGSFASNAKNVKYLNNPDYALLVRTIDLKQKFQNESRFIYVNEKAYEYLWRVKLDAESIVMPNVGNCGEIYFVTPEQLPHSRCVLGPNALLIRSEIANQKFLYYLFHSVDFQARLSKITSSTGQTKFNKTNLKQLPIPIPPLSVQEEIVRILDKFTSLEAELEAELEARKCQYEFYRNQLLAFKGGGNVLYKPLSELWILIRWNGLQKSDFVSEGKPCIHYGQIYTHYGTTASRTISQIAPELFDKLKKAEKGDVLIAWTSENIQDVNKSLVRIGDEQVAISGDMFAFRPTKTLLLPQFLNYYLQSNHYFDYKKKHARGTKVVRIPSEKILEFLIPLPPLEQQEAIVYILDHFDQLANDLTAGLPAELHLRQQQYAFYRDMLLNFSSELVSEREREH